MCPRISKENEKIEVAKIPSFEFENMNNEYIKLIIPKMDDPPSILLSEIKAAKNHFIGNSYLKKRYFDINLLNEHVCLFTIVFLGF